MTDSQHPPLNYENSASTTHRQVLTTLPADVSQCLKNARFLHLATVNTLQPSQPLPHVALMNYTFLPAYNEEGPVIIMTTNAQSLKTQNLQTNPRVSILVHDWVSHRPPTAAAVGGDRSGSPPAAATRSSLASMLLNLNTSALSSISTTIAGIARILPAGSEEEKWCKAAHLANNTFEGQLSTEAGFFRPQTQEIDSGASGYIEGDDVRVVVVPIREGRTSDFKGGVRDWLVADNEEDGREPVGSEIRGRNGQLPTNGSTS